MRDSVHLMCVVVNLVLDVHGELVSVTFKGIKKQITVIQ